MLTTKEDEKKEKEEERSREKTEMCVSMTTEMKRREKKERGPRNLVQSHVKKEQLSN